MTFPGRVIVVLNVCVFSLAIGLLAHGQTAPEAPTTQASPQASAAVATAGSLDITALGFYAGETREQITAAVGKDAVLKIAGDIMEVSASAKPDSPFDSYLLIVPTTEGLVKVVASGRDIEEDPAGKAMRAAFTQLKEQLTKVYGESSDAFDFVKSGSKLKGANDFMLALTNSDRTLSCYWTKRDFPGKVISIEMEANGLGSSKGYVSVEYEFAPYRDYVRRKK